MVNMLENEGQVRSKPPTAWYSGVVSQEPCPLATGAGAVKKKAFSGTVHASVGKIDNPQLRGSGEH